MTVVPTALDRIEADLREATSATGAGMYVTAYPEEVAQLVEVAKAAHSLHLGLTCAQDPMDVDERIERLGVVLALLLVPADNTEEEK